MIEDFYREFYRRISSSKSDCYVHYDERISYKKMHNIMLKMNSILNKYSRAKVGIYARKNFLNYTAISATILSNNIWIPFNPDIPDARNLEMMNVAKPALILVEQRLPEAIANFADRNGIKVEVLENMASTVDEIDFDPTAMKADEIAMIYFTSGSTGSPKGVPLTHENYIVNVLNILKILSLRKGEGFADYHDLAFVISVPILFPCFMTESAIAPAKSRQDIMFPIKNLMNNKVSVLITVPSTLARIRQMQSQEISNCCIGTLIMCGEPFHLDLLEYALEKVRPKAIFNFYGSTEVGPWTFYQRCNAGDVERFSKYGMVPIGVPIEGNQIEITNEGELCVAGAQITPGYLDGVNADRFYEKNGRRWFLTGDKVVYDGGFYICKGRLDSQVKVSGYRIELSDIEAHLRSITGVEAAICFVSGEEPTKMIVSVLHSEEKITLSAVRKHLRSRLPAYMLPRKIVLLKKMPLNKSGKIDRVKLIEEHT